MSVIRILETTSFLWATVSARMAVLAGTSILVRRTIAWARSTERTDGSNAHAHSNKVVTFDVRKLYVGRLRYDGPYHHKGNS
jgi:hypothetical protein